LTPAIIKLENGGKKERKKKFNFTETGNKVLAGLEEALNAKGPVCPWGL